MKKVIRLTESELIRLVKRVIKEEYKSNNFINEVTGNMTVPQLAKKFVDSFGTFNDDETSAVSCINALENESEWNAFDAEVKKISGSSVKELFNDNMSAWDRRQYDFTVQHVKDITNGKVNIGVESGMNKFLRAVSSDNLYR